MSRVGKKRILLSLNVVNHSVFQICSTKQETKIGTKERNK